MDQTEIKIDPKFTVVKVNGQITQEVRNEMHNDWLW